MSRIDQIIADVQSQDDTTERTRALIGHIKHWVAEAFAGAKLPPDTNARLAEIFPALDAKTGEIATAIVGASAVSAESGAAVMNMNASEQSADAVRTEETGSTTDAAVTGSGAPSES